MDQEPPLVVDLMTTVDGLRLQDLPRLLERALDDGGVKVLDPIYLFLSKPAGWRHWRFLFKPKGTADARKDRDGHQLGPEHPLGILMTLAAKGEWRNPPLSSLDYDRVSKAFHRLQTPLNSID